MKANDLTVLIGTTKGAFLIAGGGERAATGTAPAYGAPRTAAKTGT